jgi:hypothetical protein
MYLLKNIRIRSKVPTQKDWTRANLESELSAQDKKKRMSIHYVNYTGGD